MNDWEPIPMADRVAGEGRIPEEAVEAMRHALSSQLPPGADEQVAEIGLEAALSALPSEWLLARALTKEEIRLLRAGVPTFRGDYGAWDGAQRKLGAALSLLEQETGGSTETDSQKAERLRALAIREGWHDAV